MLQLALVSRFNVILILGDPPFHSKLGLMKEFERDQNKEDSRITSREFHYLSDDAVKKL